MPFSTALYPCFLGSPRQRACFPPSLALEAAALRGLPRAGATTTPKWEITEGMAMTGSHTSLRGLASQLNHFQMGSSL